MTKLIYFSADWCSPCEMQGPIIEDINDEFDVLVEKEDLETHGGQARAGSYSVRSIPTIVVQDDGDVVEQFTGLTQKDEIAAVLDTVIE